MKAHTEQAIAVVRNFESHIESLAWSIVGQVFEEHRQKLISGTALSKTIAKRAPAAQQAKVRILASARASKAEFLSSKGGIWDRGGGAYKLLGPGKDPNTYELENIKTGKKINTTKKTLLSRWKHFA